METFDFNIFQLLILLGSVQGLIFALIIFIRKKLRIKSNVFLGLMVVFISLSNFQHLLIDLDYLSEQSIIRKLYIPVQWLIMPMFYLHVKEIILPKRLKNNTAHFLLATVAFIFLLHILHFLYNYGEMTISKMPDYYTPGLLLYSGFVSFIFHGLILYFIYKMLQRVKRAAKNVPAKKNKELGWYDTVIKSFVIVAIVGLLSSLYLIVTKNNHTSTLYTILLLVSLMGYVMGYVGVYRSTKPAKSRNQNAPSSKSGLSTYKKVNDYILTEHRYLDMNLNLSELAQKFNISSGYLSKLINEHSKQNFNDYINALRIETSKKMLVQQEFENYTIESIGLECGFKSKSNFYTAFKKFTNQTPKEYVKSQEKRPAS